MNYEPRCLYREGRGAFFPPRACFLPIPLRSSLLDTLASRGDRVAAAAPPSSRPPLPVLSPAAVLCPLPATAPCLPFIFPETSQICSGGGIPSCSPIARLVAAVTLSSSPTEDVRLPIHPPSLIQGLLRYFSSTDVGIVA
jgi:hypothetical protein